MDDSDSDEWYYSSIKRYSKLSMFEFGSELCELELSDSDSVCVVGRHGSGQSELSELSLPTKLLQTCPAQEGLTKDSDLKIKCGTFIPAAVQQLKVKFGHRSVVTSEEGVTGATLYQLCTADTDRISIVNRYEWTTVCNPRLAVGHGDLLAMAGDSCNGCSIVDMATGQQLTSISIPIDTLNSDDQLWPFFIAQSTLGLACAKTACVFLYDQRVANMIATIAGNQTTQDRNDPSWIVNSTYEASKGSPSDFVALLSSSGRFLCYNIKNLTAPCFRCDLGISAIKRKACLRLNFCPYDSDRISISGFDGNVYIYDIASDPPRQVFVHDGHKHMDSHECETTTSGHFWFPQGRRNFIFSAALNKTLNAWQFVEFL